MNKFDSEELVKPGAYLYEAKGAAATPSEFSEKFNFFFKVHYNT